MKIELIDEPGSARRQTGGKGTKGRSFLSEEGGVYLSFLTFYENFPAARAFEVMAHAAVAVCRPAEKYGVSPSLKWANDVLAANRKLCGILVENTVKGDLLDHSIVGIGINAENDVSALGGIAVSLKELSALPVTADGVREKLIEEYQKPTEFADYLRYHRYLGGKVRVIEGDRTYEAVARAILPDGRLEIEEGGRIRALAGAEVRLDPLSL